MQGFDSSSQAPQSASAAQGNDLGSPTPPQPDQDRFPMVVWLRGDEPEVEEFSIDADRAMQLLAIKRTRLTQIAGRELRVARRRVDKYVRPFFRPVDVQAYLAWTRAPATQAHASQMLQQVLAKVSEDIQELSDTVTTHVLQRQALASEEPVTAEPTEVPQQPWLQAMLRRLERIEQNLALHQQKWLKQNTFAQHQLATTAAQIETSAASFVVDATQLTQQVIASRQHEFQQTVQLIGTLKADIQGLGDSASSMIAPILERIGGLEYQIGHFGQQIEQTFSFMLAYFQEVAQQQQVLVGKLQGLQATQDESEDTTLRPKTKRHLGKRRRSMARLT
jgi:hypothetical protein